MSNRQFVLTVKEQAILDCMEEGRAVVETLDFHRMLSGTLSCENCGETAGVRFVEEEGYLCNDCEQWIEHYANADDGCPFGLRECYDCGRCGNDI